MRLWKMLCNWTLCVLQISCSWIRMNGIHFGMGGAAERLDRGERSGKLTWRCDSGSGYDCGFFIVLKIRRWLTVGIKKCLRFYHHNLMGGLGWQGEDTIKIRSLVIISFLNTIYEINRNEIMLTFWRSKQILTVPKFQ